MKSLTIGLVVSAAVLACAAQSKAADVRLLSSAGIRPVIDAVKPKFERATGHTLNVKYVLTPQVATVAEAGEPFDVAITSPSHIATMTKANLVSSGSVSNIAKFDLGIGLRAGAAKPDISTPEALRRSLLAARSIAYVGGGATGPLIVAMLDQLGIAAEVKAKVKEGSVVSSQAAVANGDLEMTVLPIPLIKEAKGLDVAGALPAPFQNTIVMTAGVGSASANATAGEALVKFLMSVEIDGVIAANGYQRAAQRVTAR
jgi:molybdate transport system substrate-binding protein